MVMHKILDCPFSGINLDNRKLVRESTLCEYRSRVDSSMYLIDQAGENLIPNSEDFSSWTQSGICAVTANDIFGPPPNIRLTADKLDNTGDNTGYRYEQSPALGALTDRTFTTSVFLRAATAHTCTISLVEDGIGVVGTEDVSVTNTWKRFSVSGTCAGGGTQTLEMRIYPGQSGVAVGICHAYGALIVENTDNVIPGMGIYHPTDANIIYRMDLQPSNSPTHVPSLVQSYQGSREQSALLNGVNQYFSMAHDASMNIFDTDHTITILFNLYSDTNCVLFAHGQRNADGLVVRYDAPNNRINTYYSKAAAEVGPGTGPNTIRTNSWYILQIVRDTDYVNIFTNGHFGAAGSSVATYGIDANRAWVIGADSAGANPFPGEIAYLKVDKEALTTKELAEEREYLLGIAAGTSNKNEPQRYWFWDTIAPADEPRGYTTLSDASLSQLAETDATSLAVNLPRIGGKGGGVTIEYPGENMYRYSWDFTQWTKYLCTINLDATMLDPARGELTHVIIEDNNNGQHGAKLDNTLVAGQDYAMSFYVKPANRDWIYLYLNDAAPGDHSCYFDIAKGHVGTAVRSTGHIESYDNGWYRCTMTFTASGSALRGCRIYTATGDGGVVYLGLSQDSIYVYGAQFEIAGPGTTELYSTEYHSCDGTARYRQPDIMVLPLRPMGEIVPPGNPDMEIYFEDDVAATYTTETGAYVMTVNGSPEKLPDDTYPDGWNNSVNDKVRRGYMWDFDGTNDWLSRADDDTFDPAGSFSVQAIVKTDDVSSGPYHIIAKGILGDQSWELWQNVLGLNFRVYKAGGSSSVVTKAGILSTTKYFVITCTYEYIGDGTSQMRMYVNDLSTGSHNTAVGPCRNSPNGLGIGAYNDGVNKFNGQILYCSYEDGTVLTEAQHDEFYEIFIGDDTTTVPHSSHSQKRRLIDPPIIGDGEYWKKLTVEFDCNLEYSGSAERSGIGDMVEISSVLTDSVSNRFVVAYSSGILTFSFFDDAGVWHRVRTGIDPIDFNDWHKIKAYIDTTDMSNMEVYIDGIAAGTDFQNRSGTCDFDTTECSIRIGRNYQDTEILNGRVRNLKIWLEE